ncbi:MAG: hypothetical protein R3213_12280, partial [Flavobacteriaceae bacterium]|nr:hypothetical protein [Flavobacteriaceae bacterium]
MKPILKIFVLSLIGLSGLGFSYSQYTISSTKEAEIYTQIPQEKVYLNHTGNILFSGEYLYYSFYCINTQTSKLSYFSEIGYVALINEDREYVLEQKLPLKNGLGQGEIFVTTEIPSGNYKLLAYTQWMKNNGLAQVFKTDLVIINPYKNDQSQILANSDQSFPTSPIQTKDLETKSSTFLIKLEKKTFGPREKVVAEIINYQGRLGHGNYSISVQKIDELSHISPMNAVDFADQYADVLKSSIKGVGESIFLPEQDGELIYGKAFSKNPSQPFKNGTVVLSFPGNDFSLKYAKTDERGVFSTYLQENLRDSEIVIQALGEPGVNIQILNQPQLKLDNISFSNWRLNMDYLPEVRKRSIYNQIENQFYASKPDSVVVRSYTNIMLGGIPTVIKLDDYTRFPTLKETILENVLQAGIRRNESGQEYIRILQQSGRPNDVYNSFPALVLIDGVFIPNHQ